MQCVTTYNVVMGLKYRVNEEFFDRWNPVMAYVLGYWYADGSIYPSERGSYINVTSTDRSTIYKIKKWLNSQHTVQKEKSSAQNGKVKFILRIGNKKLYEALTKLGIYPSKSLTIRLPHIADGFFADFLRGYFDGDGCVYLYRTKGKTQRLILRKLSVIFTSGSEGFLKDLLANLRRYLDLRQTKVYKGYNRAFQLRLATADSIKVLNFMYNGTSKELLLKRKFIIFLKYLALKKLV